MLTRVAESEFGQDLFSAIDFSRGALVAVSGGSDSTALLLLIHRHLAASEPGATLLAVTIDHGLRPESAGEAHAVAAFCADRGIAHRTLTWTGAKPATGLPAAAREVRYRLLASAAADAGLGMIVTGHTADDQAETLLMRKARRDDAGGRGLAGMAPATLYDGRVWIVRPLLATRRAALRSFLRDQRIGWIDDPTNADDRFERPRVRKRIGDGDIDAALAAAEAAAARRRSVGRRAARLISAHASLVTPGLLRLDSALLSSDDRDGAVHALQMLLAAAGGMAFLPEHGRVETLLSSLIAGRSFPPPRHTLSRCVIDLRRAGLFLHRERRGLPAPAAAAGDMLWDGRYRFTFSDAQRSLVIAPVGEKAARDLADDDGITPASLRRAALGAEPALWWGDEFVGFPNTGKTPGTVLAEPVVAPWARFLPSFDIEPSGAVADLLGAMPPPPLIGHIAAAVPEEMQDSRPRSGGPEPAAEQPDSRIPGNRSARGVILGQRRAKGRGPKA